MGVSTASRHKLAAGISWPPSYFEISINLKACIIQMSGGQLMPAAKLCLEAVYFRNRKSTNILQIKYQILVLVHTQT